ncbi:Sporulation-specific penicillin-binding protein [Anaerohalosphaera lusitana]|uniref:Sporulation-specific penicillin-binding protein n=1 Tax=Anaerohalosphaera lusitana TaxID=1936003 RepID=A0A1U9NQQ9_9BACT|nr:penicillin-binding protein 2 [Anaerohalosphaera lusitana]AQT70117.1 Sporulation-specific penicillin-binding protein [Anaerohalosphaera lusitana]
MKTRHIASSIFVLLICIFGLLVSRLYYLQKIKAPTYRENSQRQQHAVITETPQRGIIVDRRGRIVAASNRIDTLFVEPRKLDSDDRRNQAAVELQEILQMPGHEISRIIDESANPGYVKIKEDISPDERISATQTGLEGVGVKTDWQRYYPMGRLFGHVAGFTGWDQKGQAGLELKYNDVLAGKEGKDVFVVDAFRKPIGKKQPKSLVQDGLGLVLTLDATIQQFTREAIYKQYKEYNAESAVAVVMDPKTGGILAMVSVPDFDPSDINSSETDWRRNRALTDPYEPGSIFKPIVAALALDEGVIGYHEQIFCERGNYSGKGFGRIGEWGNHRFGNLTVKEILAQSSNIGMAKIGQKMGKKKLHDGVKLFGFGQKTGIDLPGEESGVVRPLKKWDGYSITRVPFGHEVTVTAIQIARAYCILANGGRAVRPHLVRAVVDQDGKVTELSNDKPLAGYILKPEVADWVRTEALVEVVEDGTGTATDLEKWQVFGKTGTANIASGGYDETNYVASFAGGAPADDPRVVILVSVRKPDKSLRKGYSGGRVAAPVVKEILEKTLPYLRVPPEDDQED